MTTIHVVLAVAGFLFLLAAALKYPPEPARLAFGWAGLAIFAALYLFKSLA